MRKLLILALIILMSACTPKSYISKTYNFNNMKRIGVLPFNSPADFNGVENLFTKYLIKYGYTVVERAQIQAVLDEHNISMNYISPDFTRKLGKFLGVNVLLVGEITSYLPERKTMLYKETRRATSTPIYKTEMTTDADGNVKYHQTYAGQERQYNKDIYPTEYTIYAQVGVVAKMIDVNTAEVIWVGDDTQEGVSGLDALDSSAESIIKSFYKQVENAKSNSL